MKLIIETFFYLILFVIIIFTSVETFTMNMQESNAKKYHSEIINSIENSDFDPDVITDVIQKANDLGYVVTVENKSRTVDDTVIPFYYVLMKYSIDFNMLGFSKESFKSGYAR